MWDQVVNKSFQTYILIHPFTDKTRQQVSLFSNNTCSSKLFKLIGTALSYLCILKKNTYVVAAGGGAGGWS